MERHLLNPGLLEVQMAEISRPPEQLKRHASVVELEVRFRVEYCVFLLFEYEFSMCNFRSRANLRSILLFNSQGLQVT